jgi:hypothetical protein
MRNRKTYREFVGIKKNKLEIKTAEIVCKEIQKQPKIINNKHIIIRTVNLKNA